MLGITRIYTRLVTCSQESPTEKGKTRIVLPFAFLFFTWLYLFVFAFDFGFITGAFAALFAFADSGGALAVLDAVFAFATFVTSVFAPAATGVAWPLTTFQPSFVL
jgi:hypothetical protein